jgi:hypothetical protein
MEFRTTFKITPSDYKITYSNPVIFLGSCFSVYIGDMFRTGHLPVMVNPTGTIYNPVSVGTVLSSLISNKVYTFNDLYNNKGTWLSFDHYTDFSGSDPEEVLERINGRLREASEFIRRAGHLFITFGTARVYRRKDSGRVVSNCHKLPSDEFTHELLSVDKIVSSWEKQLDELRLNLPSLKVVFTISPIRHWKDGAHENQVSKSVLFLAVEELLKHPISPAYFPSYEIVMDDLRDYRFYEQDMLHLTPSAVNYIWEAFTGSYFEGKTLELWKEIVKISKATGHRIKGNSPGQIVQFSDKILLQIESILRKEPGIDLGNERKYFSDLKSDYMKKI